MIMFTLLIDIQAQYLSSERHLSARRNNTKNLWRRQNKISGESGVIYVGQASMITEFQKAMAMTIVAEILPLSRLKEKNDD